MIQQFTPRYTPKELKAGCKHLYADVHSNITHNSGKMKTTQCALTDITDKQNRVYAYNKILFSQHG